MSWMSCSEKLVCEVNSGGRRGSLMVIALDSGSSGPGSALAGDIVLCSWARHFTLSVPLSTQVL